jgi:hypothetical protein
MQRILEDIFIYLAFVFRPRDYVAVSKQLTAVGMVSPAAHQGDPEQTLPQERQLFCGTEKLRCGA